MHRLTAFFLAFALIAAACSGSGGADPLPTTTASPETTGATPTTEATTTSGSTTTTTEPASTSAPYDGPVEPLNGLPVEDETLTERRVMAIKIDNHPNARPQSGLQTADAVIEILVEGGFTRFIALFHSSDTDYLGPIRSGRPTDPSMLKAMGATFTISGAQPWVVEYIVGRGINLIGEVEGTYRISQRVAPHNLYGDTSALRNTADGRGYSNEFLGPLYGVGPWDGVPDELAQLISLSWATGNLINWQYTDDGYLRFVGTSAHNWIDRDGNGDQILFDVLVVLVGDPYTASPPAGVRGQSLPATTTVGTGNAYIFYQGTVTAGTWSRDAIEEPFALFDAEGNQMVVPPGRPWVSLLPSDRTITWS
jgi:hypothetical protein